MQAFAANGALVARSPLEVAEQSDVVITMLPAAAHVSRGMGIFMV
jgi:3-hydroxyisobutyrate dehydrogenase-like beta-hydroxyacid dehydrogenase